ncbi:hypothetical protein [Pseudofrankia saprophytica]|uniref:hypothetical protein n=1 Tax=Pseudofrankia saprophytica TaxID=298655 RepID=UPI000234C495|nr:hypothetical protein [Pseudofrankia saprophytica]
MERLDLKIDVTDAAGLGEPATIAVTVHIPDPLPRGLPRMVCFAKPGAGLSRGYFTAALPGAGSAAGSQAAWHAACGWIFVSVDHLGVGASSTHHDPARLDYTTLAAAAQAAERQVLDRLRSGTLHAELDPVASPVVLGLGQSMGGCLTVVQQGQHHCYDGIAVLGYSVVHSRPPVPPGAVPIMQPWVLRDSHPGRPPVVVNAAEIAAGARTFTSSDTRAATNWLFYLGDPDAGPPRPSKSPSGDTPPWLSTTYPGVVKSCLTPGVIASEAAAVDAPVLVAMGERDVVADPKGEPRAYLSARSVDLFVCPRMGHMHNFAATRQLLWERIDTWAAWVAAATAAAPGTVRTDATAVTAP